MYAERRHKENSSRVIQLSNDKKVTNIIYLNKSNCQYPLQKVNSSNMVSEEYGIVAKAPIEMQNSRKRDALNCIGKINNNTNFFPRGGESSVETRIDIQGSSIGNTYHNIQLQANDPHEDLKYPQNTLKKNQGTSLAEVHILKTIPSSSQVEIVNRGLHLLRSSLVKSLNDRKSYKINI